jgi:hypothetical protein
MSTSVNDTQERYNVFSELERLYVAAHQEYMAAIVSGDQTRMEAAAAECKRIDGEEQQAIALLRKHQVKRAYQHTHGGGS